MAEQPESKTEPDSAAPSPVAATKSEYHSYTPSVVKDLTNQDNKMEDFIQDNPSETQVVKTEAMDEESTSDQKSTSATPQSKASFNGDGNAVSKLSPSSSSPSPLSPSALASSSEVPSPRSPKPSTSRDASRYALPTFDSDDDEPQGATKTSPPSGSRSPVVADEKSRLSGSPSHELTQVATSLPPRRKKKASAMVLDPPQLVDHLPRADEEALASFGRLEENWYANRHIGRSKGHEWGLVCECNYRPGRDDIIRACTSEGGCVNRVCQVECLSADCRCGEYCQNQRFQRKEYADVEIIKTEKKGFGLRAAKPISGESFVYEYIGEVVEPDDFHKRMRRYHEERIPHFYFMMLQKDEYLDATKKGGIARFINHSCNPNCYVAKWHVGKHMRMGIFAQRDIVKGEELTFNYNVDRYGNDAQPCYCGEPNCVGQLGGKTQTDIGGMSNLYIEALGIVDEVERLQARGSRKQKSRILDEDFNPTLHPMEEDETSTVATAIRQAANNRSVLMKLLQRIELTDDVSVHKRFVRLHGFIMMAGVMTEWKDDRDVLMSCMKILAKWPLIARNKVVDTGVEDIVKVFQESHNEDVASLASELLDAWQQLSLEFRIARKEGGEQENDMDLDEDVMVRSRRRRGDDEDDMDHIQARMDEALDAAQAPNDVSKALEQVVPRPLGKFVNVPTGPSKGQNGVGGFHATPNRFGSSAVRSSFRGGSSNAAWRNGTPRGSQLGTPQTPDGDQRHQQYFGGSANATPASTAPKAAAAQPTMSIEEIIRRANEQQAAEALKAQQEEAAAIAAANASSLEESRHSRVKHDRLGSSSKKRKSSSKANGSSSNDHDKRLKSTSTSIGGQDFEKQTRKSLSSLIGEIVVRTMSKKRDEHPLSDKESFKKYAKDLTEILVSKELKRIASTGSTSVPDRISTEKKDKIKIFANDYIDKLIARKKSQQQQQQQEQEQQQQEQEQ
ncbi:unnamed protein product [Sympodiomycopsis kandeliae]